MNQLRRISRTACIFDRRFLRLILPHIVVVMRQLLCVSCQVYIFSLTVFDFHFSSLYFCSNFSKIEIDILNRYLNLLYLKLNAFNCLIASWQ